MSDDWDDWGDDDPAGKRSDGAQSEEEWDWPAENDGLAAELPSATQSSTTGRKPRGIAGPSPHGPTTLVSAHSTDNDGTGSKDGGKLPKRESLEKVEEDIQRARMVDDVTDKFFDELRRYLEDLADPHVREEINQELTLRDYGTLTKYYEGRADLADYTLDTELRRMKYAVVTEEGSFVGENEKSTGSFGDANVGGGKQDLREVLAMRKGHIMISMANQSIFADMLEVLQGRLLRPDLEISVISRDCRFSLDFSTGILEAHSFFGVSTIGSGELGAEETLEIAQIKGAACVDTRNGVYTQRLLSPQLRMVFDDHMRASARVLAHHFMMNGGGVDDITGGDRGRGHPRARAGLEEIGLFRQSLARASSDGMELAAAAGSGLLANVVAGVGSAIGASRTGSVGEIFGGGMRDGYVDGRSDAPLVQLYRRPKDGHGQQQEQEQEQQEQQRQRKHHVAAPPSAPPSVPSSVEKTTEDETHKPRSLFPRAGFPGVSEGGFLSSGDSPPAVRDPSSGSTGGTATTTGTEDDALRFPRRAHAFPERDEQMASDITRESLRDGAGRYRAAQRCGIAIASGTGPSPSPQPNHGSSDEAAPDAISAIGGDGDDAENADVRNKLNSVRIEEDQQADASFSAVGLASATGGAVLRGLWGGLRGVQAAASATLEGGSGGSEPTAMRLYRREGDSAGDS